MVDFINEVEDELRKDQYNVLLRKWGPLIALIAVGIVAAAGFYEYTKKAGDRAARNASIEYVAASELLAEGKTDEALSRFEAIAQKAGPGYGGLSLSRAAQIELDRGNSERAVALFDSAAGVYTKPLHKELAQYKAALILSDLGRHDEVLQRVNPLIETGKPYADLARELRGFTHLALGDNAAARRDFLFLSSSLSAGENIITRAKQMLALTPSLAAKADDAPVSAPVPVTDAADTADDNPQKDAE